MSEVTLGGGEEMAAMMRDIAKNKKLGLAQDDLPGMSAGQPKKEDQQSKDIGSDTGNARIAGYPHG